MITTKVVLWKKPVGVLLEDDQGQISFEYTPEFIKSGLNISPLHLPLAKNIYSFHPLRRSEAFMGLPGVFADSLPDKFGNKIITQYFENKGKSKNEITPLQRLLYIGDRAMGALQYEPPMDKTRPLKVIEALEIADLVKQARKVIRGDLRVKTAEIMQLGASAGGARSKAIIGWNDKTNTVIAGSGPLPSGFEHWLIKFDRAGDTEDKHTYNRAEYVYSLIAQRAGIFMSKTRLLEENGRSHFMAKRFDRRANHKIHMHSLAGITHTDYNLPQAYSYEQYFRVILDIINDYIALEQAYRRMIFNFVGRNQDDHVKNISFLMDEEGQWGLAPAFDLTYANGSGWTKQHQMTLNSKSAHFTQKEILAVGNQFSIKRPERILEEVQDTFLAWKNLAKDHGINKTFRDEVQKNIRKF